MIETTPAVRLIAEPRVLWDAVENYLRTVTAQLDDGTEVSGLHWLDRVKPSVDVSAPGEPAWFVPGKAIASDSELLVEYAGRRCYRSWAAGLNANVTKVREDTGVYLENILSSKHGAVLEHAQFTFDFDQVSRVFTHELVRHRAGVAISQESLRYVRLTNLGVRIPPILEPMREELVSIVETLEEFQREAAEAFGLDDEGVPFHHKKEVTSALRRLAPIGLSTGMVWSANVRTLRHVIAQRTAPSAEEEIRIVFDQVARIVTKRYPYLFGDFKQVHAIEWQRAAIEARGASIVMRPDRLGGGPHVAGTVIPTEDIVVTYQACQSLTATAEHHRITVAQVWVALWFEAGCDSRRRYHL